MNITSIFSMQSEISLIAVLLLMLIADLILNESRYKARRNIACGLLIAHIILNLVPYTAEENMALSMNFAPASAL